MSIHRGLFVLLLLPVLACAAPVRSDAGGEEDGERYAGREHPPLRTPDWFSRAVFYQIFPRSFHDSDGDGIGDLRGIVEKLDYLNDGAPQYGRSLGVSALWLTPINPSPSYHGYDVSEYQDVNPQFGSLADFELLVAEARRRGIRVIIDLVLNHSSSRHPWFQAALDPGSPFRRYYVWRRDMPAGWQVPWGGGSSSSVWHREKSGYYYAAFWRGMPDLNHDHAALREEMARVIRFWLARGADGFRLDAVRYLIERGGGAGQRDTRDTHLLLQEYARIVKRSKPDAVLVGEAWSGVQDVGPYYGNNNSLDAAFNFDLSAAILEAVRRGDGSGIHRVHARMAQFYPARFVDAPFLANHDTVRVANQLGDDPARLRKAALILLTMPGAPFLYYGEEIAMRGTKPDEDLRRPMQWSGGTQAGFTRGKAWRAPYGDQDRRNVRQAMADPRSLWHLYRRLIVLRRDHPGLARGRYRALVAPAGVLAHAIEGAGPAYLVVHNLVGEAREVKVDGIAPGRRIFEEGGARAQGAVVHLPAQSSAVFTMR